MTAPRRPSLAAALSMTLFFASAPPARAQVVFNETGFTATQLSGDFAKQVELGVGPDTCLYYGSFEGLRRICAPSDTGTICDPSLTFPVGIAFSTTGSFGHFMYVSDYNSSDIHRSAGCGPTTLFATLSGPGALAFPPSGSAYGDFLYTCEAFSSPIDRVSSTGVVTAWTPLNTTYLKFGPGGVWGTGLYATVYGSTGPDSSGIDRVSSAGVISKLFWGLLIPEGFDWAFDGDMFATDAGTGEILRVKSNGTTSLFATVSGAADVAYRPGEAALYVVSNQGGLYRIRRSSTAGVGENFPADAPPTVSPNPASGSCALRFSLKAGGVTRVNVVDAQGRLVRRLSQAWQPAGAHSLAWDGRDEAGAPVRPGNYWLRVPGSGSARVTIVR